MLTAGFLAAGFAAWESIGPYGGTLGGFAASTDESAFYASSSATPSMIVKSADSGSNWSSIGSINDYVYSLAVDPTDANVVYAGALNYVYKSTNGGYAWQGYSLPANAYYAIAIAINPSSPSIVYASGYYYNGSASVPACFKSTNAGISWQTIQLGSYSGMGYSVAVDPSSPQNVYVCGYYWETNYHPCVYKSTNGGTSFTETSSGIPVSAMYVEAIRVHPTTGSIVYAGTYWGGIFRSTNAGATWTGGDTTWKLISSFSAQPIAANVCYAAGDTMLYKTTNAGVSWTPSPMPFANGGKAGRIIHASRGSSSLVVITDAKGFYKSTNGGANWFESNHGITIAAAGALSAAPSSPATIYTEYEGVGVFRSSDNGAAWTILPTPLECGAICEFAVHQTNPNNIMGLEGLG
jgi:photosystem II stability/assembly factor-like uncharacterized protein